MEVKVGNKIYFERFGKITSVQEVIKITPTGIIRTDNGYSLKGDGSYLKVLGQDNWAVTNGRLETPELKQRWREQQAISWLSNNYHRIKAEDIEPLMEKYGKA